jgi:hypothetical protein
MKLDNKNMRSNFNWGIAGGFHPERNPKQLKEDQQNTRKISPVAEC